MSQGKWEADKMLDVYIYDYMIKRNLHETAKLFMAEGKVATDPVAIDAPGGFLFEWWSVFWDIFIARTNGKHSDDAAAYFQTQQMKDRELQLHQYQQLPQVQLQRRDVNRPALSNALSGINSDALLRGSATSKLYDGHLKNINPIDPDGLLKHTTNYQGVRQLVQGNGSFSPQIQARNPQISDIRPGSGVGQRSLPTDPSSFYGQGPVQGKSGLGGTGFNQGVNGPDLLNGMPVMKYLQGNDLTRPNFGQQIQRPFMSTGNQILAVQNNFGNSHNYGDMDPRKLRPMSRAGLSGQSTGHDGSLGSPVQTSSPMVRHDQAEYAMKMTQMQQSSAQLPQEQLQQQHQLQQNNRKRKPTSSGPANSTGTGNTVGPSLPSTPSTNVAGDGVAMVGNMPQINSIPKGSMMYGTTGAGLTSASNQMDDLEQFGDISSFDEQVDSFLANDGDSRDIFAPMKSNSAEHNADTSKDSTCSEISCDQSSKSKVLCCHFSSDGKLLASAGNDKKVLIWNMGTYDKQFTPEEHTLMITDICFRPDSTQFATSSFDRTVRLWNAAEPGFSMHTFSGHSSQVTSLDFHPKKTDILCSCDDTGEIRLWNVVGVQRSSPIYHKDGGGFQHVRFQPKTGQLLAAATESVISIFEFETKQKICTLQGHNEAVKSFCWDQNGDYLATVSHDVVKVWSSAGEHIRELNSAGNKIHSCLFHPTYPGLLILGGYETLIFWNIKDNKTTVKKAAHEGLIVSLAHSVTGLIASASHDRSVKVWK